MIERGQTQGFPRQATDYGHVGCPAVEFGAAFPGCAVEIRARKVAEDFARMRVGIVRGESDQRFLCL